MRGHAPPGARLLREVQAHPLPTAEIEPCASDVVG
jgi:hypothetical protein